jgi:hypothetical protein
MRSFNRRRTKCSRWQSSWVRRNWHICQWWCRWTVS